MTEPSTTDHPVLSVIIPVYNSTDQLRRCLDALADSAFRGYEVIVVDDGSNEPVATLAAGDALQVIRIDGPKGPARARNRGVEASSGELLVFIDADCCVHRDTLERIAQAFKSDPGMAALVGCYDDSPAELNFLSQYKNLFHRYVHLRSAGEITTFWSGCGAMRRDLFLSFGGFNERYSRPAIEDIELGTLVAAAGHRIVLDSSIQVKHLKRWTLWSLLRTDIFDRAVPWTRLMLRTRIVTGALNLKSSQRASVLLACLTVVALMMAVVYPFAWIAAGALAGIVTALNLDFYRYLAARRGLWFSIRATPLHWLYFGYCAFSVVWGMLIHYLSERDESSSIPVRKADT